MSLKELRQRAGLLQEDVAREMDVTQAAVSRWESGDTKRISRKYHKKLAQLYGVSESQLFADSSITHDKEGSKA